MKKPSSRPAKTPVGRKAVRPKSQNAKPARAKISFEPAQNLIVSADDQVAIDAVARVTANSIVAARVSRKRSALDRLDDPPPAPPESSLVERVSNAIKRELSKIETIIGASHVPPVLRSEAESRARVLASLARTLKEVMQLREQERDTEETMTDRYWISDGVPRVMSLGELATFLESKFLASAD